MKKVKVILVSAALSVMTAMSASAEINILDPVGTVVHFGDMYGGGFDNNGIHCLNFDKNVEGMYYDLGPVTEEIDEATGEPKKDENGNVITAIKNDTFDGQTKYLHMPAIGTRDYRSINIGDRTFHYFSNKTRTISYPNMSKSKIEFDVRFPYQEDIDFDGDGFFSINTVAIDGNNNMSEAIGLKGFYIYSGDDGSQSFFLQARSWDDSNNYIGQRKNDTWYHIDLMVSIPDDEVEINIYEYNGQSGNKTLANTKSYVLSEALKRANSNFGDVKYIINGGRMLVGGKQQVDLTNIKYWRDEFAVKEPTVKETDTKLNAEVKIANNAYLPNWFYNQNTDLTGSGYALKDTTSPVAIFVQYNADGEMVAVDLKNIDVPAVHSAQLSNEPLLADIPEPEYVSLSAELDKNEEYDHMKVFVWDKDWNMIPYRDAFSTAPVLEATE